MRKIQTCLIAAGACGDFAARHLFLALKKTQWDLRKGQSERANKAQGRNSLAGGQNKSKRTQITHADTLHAREVYNGARERERERARAGAWARESARQPERQQRVRRAVSASSDSAGIYEARRMSVAKQRRRKKDAAAVWHLCVCVRCLSLAHSAPLSHCLSFALAHSTRLLMRHVAWGKPRALTRCSQLAAQVAAAATTATTQVSTPLRAAR